MPIPSVKRIRAQDVPDSPDWLVRLLVPLNSFLTSVYEILNRGLTFQDNFAASIREFQFTTASDYTSGTFEPIKFTHGIRGGVSGVLAFQTWLPADADVAITGGVSVSWNERDGQVFIKYVSGLTNSTTYKIRLLVL